MPYTRRSARKKSTPRPLLAVRTASKKVPVARRSTVMKLARSVKRLQVAKYGAPQVQRQNFRSSVGATTFFSCSATQPVAFCLEAICTGNEVYTTQKDGLGNYSHLSLGSWQQQPFPLNAANAANAKYDFQINRNTKNLGVRSTYLYRGTSLDIQVFAKAINGYLHCYEITPRATVVRAVDQERTMPFCIPAFVNMGGGGEDVYDHSSQFFTIRKKWTKYYNVIGGTNPHRFIQTNNLSYKRMWHRGRKLIVGADVAGVDLVRDQDIHARKQTWLLFTFSSSDVATADSFCRLQIQKTVHWSDSEGSK